MADHNDRTPHIPGQRQEHPAANHDQALDFPAVPPVPSLGATPWRPASPTMASPPAWR
jgi:hypothetical protein